MQATRKSTKLSLTRGLAAAGLLAASLATPALAQTVNFNFSTLNPAAGTFTSCNSTERCATTPGGAMSFSSGGLTVLASGFTRSNTGAASGGIAMQDPNSPTPSPWIGLGVYAAGQTGNLSTDQIGLNDVLKLDFGNQLVRLADLRFYNASHGTSFDTNGKWGLSLTAPTAGSTFTQYAFAANGVNDIPDITGKTFYLYGLSNTANQSFYLGNMNVTAVPEPGTLGLMAAGLGVVGMVSRRRKALAQG